MEVKQNEGNVLIAYVTCILNKIHIHCITCEMEKNLPIYKKSLGEQLRDSLGEILVNY